MPRLWTDTIKAHRREVRDAILDTTAALVAENGRRSVTMSQIAEETGIGRATLYKYFPDVDAILAAWHDRHMAGHLQQLTALSQDPGDAAERLEAVLQVIGRLQLQHHAGPPGELRHRDEHVGRAQQHLGEMIGELIAAGVEAGSIRNDVPVAELVDYCLRGAFGARALGSEEAVSRLATLIVAGLRAPADDAVDVQRREERAQRVLSSPQFAPRDR
ncbi:MAG: TetR/AcrR family transcriptional regulator [Candidatus Dormibacteraeota bacterium]|nr:TetR/AcrR family transcriptional regulator [Candidatus Dormibacteraeota bacterium]MBO0746013.1 TetR/AcrR family transcriptional regulator [Candidatus Dormibacteraeota bacterium]